MSATIDVDVKAIVYKPLSRSPVHLAIVIDTFGSMTQGDEPRVRRRREGQGPDERSCGITSPVRGDALYIKCTLRIRFMCTRVLRASPVGSLKAS